MSTRVRNTFPHQAGAQPTDRDEPGRGDPRAGTRAGRGGFVLPMVVTIVTALLAAVMSVGLLGGPQLLRPELWTQPYANAAAPPVLARGLVLVKDTNGPDAALVGALLNTGQGPDALTGVQVATHPDAPVAPAAVATRLSLALPPDELVSFGGPGKPTIRIRGPADPPRVGTFLALTLTFREAGQLRLDVLFENPAEYLRPYAPGPPTTAAAASGAPAAPARAVTGSLHPHPVRQA